MRRIKVEKWIGRDSEGNDVEESTISALTVLISYQDPRTMPKGLEQFKIFKRINEAFEKSVELGVIELEEAEYKFLKSSITNNIPAFWGASKEISKAIDGFMDAVEE